MMNTHNEKVVGFDLKKLSNLDFEKYRAEISKQIKETQTQYTKINNAVLTLENYAERYVPLVMINTTMELLATVLDEKRLKKMNKAFNRMHNNLSKSIQEDQGNGSIFQNIL